MQPEAAPDSLASLSEEARKLHLCEFWTEVKKLEILEPRPVGSPHVWQFAEIHPRLLRAAKIVPIEEAERRAVVFRNPGLGGRIATTPTLYAAYSLYNPGERAPVHRHTAAAGRIGLLGRGGYTTVEGEKCMLERGDLVLTPNWAWHDHGNEGSEQNVWFDILDVPLILHLNSLMFDFTYAEGEGAARANQAVQSARHIVDAETNRFAMGGVLPHSATDKSGPRRMFFYPWAQTREALKLARTDGVNPYEGVSVRLSDPTTGGYAMPTIDYCVKLLPAGRRTLPMRHTAHSIFLVMEGQGHTMVGDQRLDWQANDVFCVPNWMWHEHINGDPDGDAVLYAMSDEPVMKQLDFYRQQGRAVDGTTVQLA